MYHYALNNFLLSFNNHLSFYTHLLLYKDRMALCHITTSCWLKMHPRKFTTNTSIIRSCKFITALHCISYKSKLLFMSFTTAHNYNYSNRQPNAFKYYSTLLYVAFITIDYSSVNHIIISILY